MEKRGYREVLDHLTELFPGKATITVKEAALVMDAEIHTVYNAINRLNNPLPAVKLSERKTVIPISRFARWLC